MLNPRDNLHPILRELREIRLAWNLSQAEVARLAGCGRTVIALAERGEATPNFRIVENWCRALGYHLALTSGNPVDCFDQFPIKSKTPNEAMYTQGHCADCGKKRELLYDRCQQCFKTWAEQVQAVQRAFDRQG